MERRNALPPVHPGEIIKEDILPSVGLSVTAAAKALGVSRQMLHDILAGHAQSFRRGRHGQADRRQDVLLDNLARMDGRQSVLALHNFLPNSSLKIDIQGVFA